MATDRSSGLDAGHLLEKVRALEMIRQQEEKDRSRIEAQRRKEMEAAKRAVAKEVQLAAKLVRKTEMEVHKVSRDLCKLQEKAGQVEQKKAKQVVLLDEQVQKVHSKHQELEGALQEKMAGVGEARARLASAELAARMLELGVVFTPRQDMSLSAGSQALHLERERSAPRETWTDGDDLLLENTRLSRENQELRHRLDLIEKVWTSSPRGAAPLLSTVPVPSASAACPGGAPALPWGNEVGLSGAGRFSRPPTPLGARPCLQAVFGGSCVVAAARPSGSAVCSSGAGSLPPTPRLLSGYPPLGVGSARIAQVVVTTPTTGRGSSPTSQVRGALQEVGSTNGIAHTGSGQPILSAGGAVASAPGPARRADLTPGTAQPQVSYVARVPYPGAPPQLTRVVQVSPVRTDASSVPTVMGPVGSQQVVLSAPAAVPMFQRAPWTPRVAVPSGPPHWPLMEPVAVGACGPPPLPSAAPRPAPDSAATPPAMGCL